MAIRMSRTLQNEPGDYTYLMALLLDVTSGTMETVSPDVLGRVMHCMTGFKSKQYDSNAPTFTEAMRGMYREDFLEAMGDEVEILESHDTWEEV